MLPVKFEMHWIKKSSDLRCSQSAFTLIELVVVLCILTVLGAVTVPGVIRWKQRMPLDTAFSTLQVKLQETRLAAIRSGEQWCLTLPDRGQTGSVQSYRDRQQVGSRISFLWPEGISVVSISADTGIPTDGIVEPIVFNPDGTSFSRELQLVSRSGQMIRIRVDRLTGQTVILSMRQRKLTESAEGTFVAVRLNEMIAGEQGVTTISIPSHVRTGGCSVLAGRWGGAAC